MPTLKINDIQMYHELHGSGEPLVLIGGLGTDISDYASIIGWLAQKYRVLAFDNRGAGRSDKPDMPYSIEMMADDTAGLMNALDMKQAAILGTSMGGRIALALALQHPERVSRLILVSTSARSGPRNRLRRLFGMLGSQIFKSKYPQPRYAFIRQREASSTFNCTDRLREIHVPTVIMHGKKDKTVPYALAEEMHAGISGSQMLTFEGSHIFFFMRGRQQFLDAVAMFIQRSQAANAPDG